MARRTRDELTSVGSAQDNGGPHFLPGVPEPSGSYDAVGTEAPHW
jgi:hypothetical protein